MILYLTVFTLFWQGYPPLLIKLLVVVFQALETMLTTKRVWMNVGLLQQKTFQVESFLDFCLQYINGTPSNINSNSNSNLF